MDKLKKEIKINVYLRILFLFICIATASYISTTNLNAKSNDNFSEYESVCKEALETVQGINNDNLKVYVGNIYNVIDTEGNLNGYSLGYFVDDEPYGYAIYNLTDKSIREFVLQPGVKNIYEELEDKAQNTESVNEDELIDGVVYDGGIGYSTYDFDGNKIDINDIYPDE